MTKLEKVFTTIGVVGFLFLLPGILLALGIDAPAQFLSKNLGAIGDLSVLTLIAFILIGFAIFFGGGSNLMSTFLGMVVGFLLISTAAGISWMKWFSDLVHHVPLMTNNQLNYLTGIGVVGLGFALSFSKKLTFLPQILILFVLPISFILIANGFGLMKSEKQFQLSISEGYHTIAKALDEKYQSMPAVKSYIESLKADNSLSDEEKKEKLDELEERLGKQDGDIKTLEELKRENEQFRQLLKEQMEELKNVGWCESAKDTAHRAVSFEQAVKPQAPCVRDFAVSLVKNHPGSYHGSNSEHVRPGDEGVEQIAAIHMYLSSSWKYVSDPSAAWMDFNSPADRTLAIGLAGDCDDYSIIMASAVEAIGGKTRIMGGSCSGGHHAWTEVYIGSESDSRLAQINLRKFYNNQSLKINYSKDEAGNYWLPLDWRLGQFTCNESELIQVYSMEKRIEIQKKEDIKEMR